MVNLHDWFIYDESSPTCLRNKVDRRGGRSRRVVAAAGDVAGCEGGRGYLALSLHGQHLNGGRVVWEMHNGPIPQGMLVDHKDGNRMNNKIDNLRLVTHAVNTRNKKRNVRNSSGKTGVRKISKCRCGNTTFYWLAFWTDSAGIARTRCFSVRKHGEEVAFHLACQKRDEMIAKLNEAGAGYTERHNEERIKADEIA